MICSVDLHTHTHYSGDGVSSPEDLIASAKSKGLNAVAITDHNTCDALAHLSGAGLLRADGRAVDGFLVIPGVEVSTAEGHLLCIGAVLRDPLSLKGAPAAEVCAAVRAAGGLAIPPHPFDTFRAGIRPAVLDTLELDAIEVFNAASTFKRYNRRAQDYAARRGVPMIAASDAHYAEAVGVASCEIEVPELTVGHVLAGILRGATLNKGYLTLRAACKKTFANFLRISRKRKVPPLIHPDIP